MNKRHSICSFKLLAALIFTFSVIYAFALKTENDLMFQSTQLAVVPLLLTLYFVRLKYMSNLFFSVFLLFLMGHVLSVTRTDPMAIILSKSAFIGSYFLMILILITKLKRVKFEGLVSLYLIFVCLINSYFFIIFYDIIRDSFASNLDLTFYIVRSVVLIAMCFLAFTVYLSNESKQSILFLSMSFCFVFSDVLNYITELYIYYWLFDWIGNVLHLLGLTVLLIYVTNHNRKSSPLKMSTLKKKLEEINTERFQREITQ